MNESIEWIITYFVKVKGLDGFVFKVRDDVNRPNNPDPKTVLEDYLHENYGNREYEYREIERIENFSN
ncbi:hypothetical protein LG951_05200 [Bacillus pumilus]|uniref:hypothetical protein n=1 Tax=Bacillus pumilus TaxID=1408 RepID=UPI001D00FE06|nr:hypothetical protein [Bacillus pumilus]UDF17588.1 hypothetical protein LG951_05200 [Bacillus pumilus]